VTASKVIQRYPGGHPAKEEEHLHECVYILSLKTIKKDLLEARPGLCNSKLFLFPLLALLAGSWLQRKGTLENAWRNLLFLPSMPSIYRL